MARANVAGCAGAVADEGTDGPPFLPMSSLAQLLAPLAMLSALVVGDAPETPDAVVPGMDEGWAAAIEPQGPPLVQPAGGTPGWGAWVAHRPLVLEDAPWNQVRIEQRMIIRIAPRAPGRDSFAPPPMRAAPPRFNERKMARCVPVGGIAGVQIQSDERLLLHMRDRRLVGASLDKACSARDFYSGFYIEQTGDGQLCAGRDMIHSRAGATCSISRLREMVPEN